MALATLFTERFSEPPAHIGELLLGDGVDGAALTVIFTESVLEQPVEVMLSVSL